ncbi:MAG: conjugal transfer protein TraH [Rickettsiaceae bacterium]|nr:conjugal transfer protein TraH [Rickettsiaceae bacterium]
MGMERNGSMNINCSYYVGLMIMVLFSVTSSYANIDKLIKNVMPDGTMHNTTRGAIIKGQEAGHLIGGSVMIKTPASEELQLLSVQPPSCKLGGLPCGAQIDIRGGGFSFVSAGAMSDFLKKMAQGVPAYATLMMIKTISPQIEDIMTYLNDVAAAANKLAIDQCEAMEALLGAPLSKLNAGSKATRQSAIFRSGSKKDMISIQEDSREESDNSKSGAEEDLESLLGDNYNLVWKALEKKSMKASGDSSFRELLMSVSGTIIGTKKDGAASVVHKNSLVNKELIKEFIGSSTGTSKLRLYSCDTTSSCLNPVIVDVAINADDTLMGQVTKLLKSISTKIYNNKGDMNTDNGFTSEEESLISLATIPIIRKIEMDLATYKDPAWAVYAQGEFVEALCYDVVTNYLSMLLNEVSMAVGEMSRVQLTDSSIFNDFGRETSRIMKLLEQSKIDSFHRYNLIEQSKATLRQRENEFNRLFEEFISRSNF